MKIKAGHLTKAAYIVGHYARTIIKQSKKGMHHDQLYNYVEQAARELLDTFSFDVHFEGLENMVAEPAIICPNHTSTLDMPALVMLPGRQYFSPKKELFVVPYLGEGDESNRHACRRQER